jgi:hypothetical protein
MQPDPSEHQNIFAAKIAENGMIFPVEPSDLKSVWKMTEERRNRSDRNEHTATDVQVFAQVCSPGANVMAVWYRASMLGMLVQSAGLLAPELPHEAKDAVFNVAARFPIKFMVPGVVHEGLPMDVQEFMKQVEDELGRLGFKI